MDEKWKIAKAFRYEGGADTSADVDFGLRFDLVRVDGGETRAVNVEAVTGRPDGVNMSEVDARQAVREHLSEDDPPRRILFLHDGSFQAEPPADTAS